MKSSLSLMIFTSLIALSPSALADKVSPQPLQAWVGHYSCSLTQFDGLGEKYTYPDFRCEISQQGDSYTLEKTSGSQRFRGKITANENGFSFNGIFFCPWGECTSDLTGVYTYNGNNQFTGEIHAPSEPHDYQIVNLKRL